MKTKFFALAAILFVAVFFTSCFKLDKVLVKKDGTWNVVSFHWKQTLGSTTIADTTISNWGTITFKDDGTGTVTPSDTSMFGAPSTFTWTADDKEDKLTIISSGDTSVMDVVDGKAKSMTLTSTSTDSIMVQASVTDQTMNLERK